MSSPCWMPLRSAWHRALYGPGGFYLRERPGSHFRTSVHTGRGFAAALGRLADQLAADEVWDLGSGGGELLAALSDQRPDLRLSGVDVAPRPAGLSRRAAWHRVDLTAPGAVPSLELGGLVVANELLDNVPCDVVELTGTGELCLVEVDITTGRTRAGGGVEASSREWLDRWWPLRAPGGRAEVGSSRDELWAAICASPHACTCIAIDYGHLRASRPGNGALRAFADGRESDPAFDGSRDVTAGVAFDSLQATGTGRLHRQAARLQSLGVQGSRPARSLADASPMRYLAELAGASAASEVTARSGLGGYWWLEHTASAAA